MEGHTERERESLGLEDECLVSECYFYICQVSLLSVPASVPGFTTVTPVAMETV